MLKLRVLGLLAALSIVAVFVGSNANDRALASGPGGDLYFPDLPTQSPVLVYDVTGGTLAGIVHFNLSVYNTGFASVSAAGFNVFDPRDDGSCPNDGKATYDYVSLDDVKQLQSALKAAGAYQATNGQQGLDVPQHTVTVFSGRGPDTKAHSFTFQFGSSPEIQATMEVINAFVDAHFPGY